jgi:hypothetical protein
MRTKVSGKPGWDHESRPPLYDRIVFILKHVHLSLDYELSPTFPTRWEWQIVRLYTQRDKLMGQLKEYRVKGIQPKQAWPRR